VLPKREPGTNNLGAMSDLSTEPRRQRQAPPLRRLRADVADVRTTLTRPTAPTVPLDQRTRVRKLIEAAFNSRLGQRTRGDLQDLVDRARRRRDPLVPPRRLQLFVGRGDFRAIGQEFRGYFIDLAKLEPHHDVLDVGSGSGRIAVALGGWLTGRYEGFDIAPEPVEWCQSRITPRYGNFGFKAADVHSVEYNPAGRYSPEEYEFPYNDASFDFAILTSVFTHLLTPGVDNYLSELARVLRPGGRCFATYFLINEEARRLLGGTGQFANDHGGHLTVDDVVPERVVAFPEDRVRAMHERHGLPIESIQHGSWCGRTEYLSYQDIAISRRR
jgi:SAM-dependent methyltransferase